MDQIPPIAPEQQDDIPSPNQSDTVQTSKKRLVLAWYLDFLLYSVILGLTNYWMDLVSNGFIIVVLSGVIAFFSVLHKRHSMGRHFLSISQDDLVPTDIKQRESWPLMIMSTIYILDGFKRFEVLTMENQVPLFGIITDPYWITVLSVLLACLHILSGYWIYKLDKRGWLLALGLTAILAVLTYINQDAIKEYLADAMVERREFEQRAVDEELLSFLQATFIPFVLGFSAIFLAILVIYRDRFR